MTFENQLVNELKGAGKTIKSKRTLRLLEADKPKEPRPLEPADILHQQKLIKEHATKFESAFIKEIRAIMEGHTQRNVAMYLQSLEAKRLKLLKEKLRRLQLSVAKQKIHKSSKDLFG
jgi:hypothetical protein